MNPNYEKVFLDKRLQPHVPDHQERIIAYLRFYETTDAYEDLYNHYAPLLEEQGIFVEKAKHKVTKVTVQEEVKESEKEKEKEVEKEKEPKEEVSEKPKKKLGRPKKKSTPSK